MLDKNLFLTILIPTRNRAKDLNKSLNRTIRSVEHARTINKNIEVVIVNNFSSDNTEEIAKSWVEKYEYVKYYKHQEPYPSAEESLFYGLQYASGEYVWSFGDDDFMDIKAVTRMVKVLSTKKYDLVIQNVKFLYDVDFEKASYHYIPSAKYKNKIIEYETHNLFKDFGFHHITAGFSATCFKKEKFKTEVFLKLINTSKIYSYAVAIFVSFCRSNAAFLPEAMMTATMNTEKEEFENISRLAIKEGFLSCFAWSNGFIRLLNMAAKESGASVNYFSKVREIIFDRSGRVSVQSFLTLDLQNHLKNEFSNLKNGDILRYRERILMLLEDYSAYFTQDKTAFINRKSFMGQIKKLKTVFQRNYFISFILYYYHLAKFRRITKKISTYYTHEVPWLNLPKKLKLGHNIALHYCGKVRDI